MQAAKVEQIYLGLEHTSQQTQGRVVDMDKQLKRMTEEATTAVAGAL